MTSSAGDAGRPATGLGGLLPRVRTDMLVTACGSVAIALGLMGSLRLAAVTLDPAEVAEYVLSRRAVSFGAPLFLLGLGVGLPRFIAASLAHEAGDERPLLRRALILVVMTLLGGLVLVLALPGVVSQAVFATPRISLATLVGLWATTGGAVMTGIAFGFWRGSGRFRAGVLLNVASLAVAPLVGLGVARGSFALALLITGGMQLALSCAALVRQFAELADDDPRPLQRTAPRTMVSYSLQRVPGDLAVAGLISIPTFVLASIATPAEGAVVALGMTFLSLMTAALAPLSTVMLPTATRVKIQGRAGELRPWIARFGIAAAVAGTALALVVAWQAPLVIRFFLGTTFLPYAALLRWTAIAIPGWALFVSFRSMVDAFYARAITSVSACIALALLVVIGAVTWRAGVGAVPLVVGLGATMLLLGLATSVAAIRGAVHPELPVSAVRP